MPAGDLLILIGVVWVGIAVFMGALAESEGNGGWVWFSATLLFGIFAVFVYWATNSAEGAEERDSSQASFIVAAQYGMLLLVSLVIAVFLGWQVYESLAPIPTGVNFAAESYTGPPTERIYEVRGMLRNLVYALVLMTSMLGYYWIRQRSRDKPRDSPSMETGAVGALSVTLGIIGLASAYSLITAAYEMQQTIVGAVGGGLTAIILLLAIWFTGVRRMSSRLPRLGRQRG